jgi:sulfatase modifying factor 1
MPVLSSLPSKALATMTLLVAGLCACATSSSCSADPGATSPDDGGGDSVGGEETGGRASGSMATGGIASDGGTGSGGTASPGSGGTIDEEEPLTPTADCIHPDVQEDCDGNLCRIEAGCFIMGAPPAEFGRALVNSDQVQVTLTHSFLIGRTELTRAQWSASGLERPKLVQLNGKRDCVEDDCPQGNATFYDILRYANRRSEQEGFSPCYEFTGEGCTGSILTDDYECPTVRITAPSPYECEGYRLPMEAEWEYAARAGSKTAFYSGEIAPQRDTGGCYFDAALDEVGWYCMNSLDEVQRVAQKPPNAWGLFDVHGNVSELVNDLYSPSGYLKGPYAESEGPLTDPTGTMTPPDDITKTDQQVDRVTRSGTHNFTSVTANVSRRVGLPDFGGASNLGFRIARTLHE